MSTRKRGDHADQELMPFVERVAPTGKITSSPKLTATKAVEPTPASMPPETSVPITPRSTDAPAPQRLEGHFVWHGLLRGARARFSYSDARSRSEQLTWAGLRLILHIAGPALGLALALTNCSGGTQVTKDGWAPVIERAP